MRKDGFGAIARVFKQSDRITNTTAVVFDLDSTLFCVSPRTQAILRRLASEVPFSERYQPVADALKTITVTPLDWGIRSALERLNLEATAEMIETVREYWRTHFCSNSFLNEDIIYPNANEYVRRLKDLGAKIIYLTGRPEALMRTGTLESLDRWKFPLESSEDLYMKPDVAESDEHFKVTVLKRLNNAYSEIWFFENEPLIINMVQAELPQTKIIFVNSIHAGKASPPNDLYEIGMSYLEGLKALE